MQPWKDAFNPKDDAYMRQRLNIAPEREESEPQFFIVSVGRLSWPLLSVSVRSGYPEVLGTIIDFIFFCVPHCQAETADSIALSSLNRFE